VPLPVGLAALSQAAEDCTAGVGAADEWASGGHSPFNITNIDGDLFVTYAKQDAEAR